MNELPGRLDNGSIERQLLCLEPGQVGEVAGLMVHRLQPDWRLWRVAGGEPALLLVAIDQVARLARRADGRW